MKFQVHFSEGLARRGTLTSIHGKVETPAFMPVGTYGAVKAMSPEELQENQYSYSAWKHVSSVAPARLRRD